MVRESLLKGTVYATASTERRAATLAEAEEARKSAFSELVITIDDQAEAIAERFTKPLDGVLAETAYLTKLHEMLNSYYGGPITSLFANDYGTQPEPQALDKADTDRIQGELDRAKADNRRLQNEAHEASDLRAELQQMERDVHDKKAENADLREQLRLANEKVGELQAQADKPPAPNPLTARVKDLEGKLSNALADKATAEAKAEEWRQMAISHGYVEPTTTPASEPTPPESDSETTSVVPGMTEPATPTQGRRSLRSIVPGHGRTQGGGDK